MGQCVAGIDGYPFYRDIVLLGAIPLLMVQCPAGIDGYPFYRDISLLGAIPLLMVQCAAGIDGIPSTDISLYWEPYLWDSV